MMKNPPSYGILNFTHKVGVKNDEILVKFISCQKTYPFELFDSLLNL